MKLIHSTHKCIRRIRWDKFKKLINLRLLQFSSLWVEKSLPVKGALWGSAGMSFSFWNKCKIEVAWEIIHNYLLLMFSKYWKVYFLGLIYVISILSFQVLFITLHFEILSFIFWKFFKHKFKWFTFKNVCTVIDYNFKGRWICFTRV